MHEFLMPSLGADMEAGTLREWRVKVGDIVKRGDIIADVETQKGIVEIEVFDSGKIEQLLIQVNDKVPVGSPMALIQSEKEEVVTTPQPKISPLKEKTVEKIPEKIIREQRPSVKIKASPLAKKVAEELHVDLTYIHGSGPGGAITKEDVEKASTEKEKPTVSTETIRQAVAAAMSKSNREIPHYYLETRIDMSVALKWLTETNKQRELKKRVLPIALLIKALAKALKEVPQLNAIWDTELKLKEEIHIGLTISLRTGGVIIPAIHHADKKTVDEIMEIVSDIIPRARALKLRSSELADSTITMTSLGENNVETVYGVIYPPQVAIIGFGAITEQPWAENEMVGARPVLIATLAGDHRATDGQTGSRLLNSLKRNLLNPNEL